MNDDDIQQLISRYLDGVETPEELKSLEELIGTDPRAREELLRMATQDAMVRQTFAEGAATNARIAGDHSSAPTHGVLEMPRPGRSRRRQVFFWGSAAAAAGLVITLGVWRFALPHGVVSDDTTGTVVEMRGTVNMERTAIRAREGDVLRVGDGMVVGEDGLCRFRYADGSVIAVHSNSVFRLIEGVTPSAKSVFLEKGMLMADARKQRDDARMTFKTPHASATIVGTQLSLTAGDMGTALNVISGAVEFAAADSHETVRGGESAVARDGIVGKTKGLGAFEADDPVFKDGEILFQDSFENGLTNWSLYTKNGPYTGDGKDVRMSTTEQECPDVRVVSVRRNGGKGAAVSLNGREPEGPRVGIVTLLGGPGADTFSINYEYTYEGRQRLAMEGIEIDMARNLSDPPRLGGSFSKKALPPGEWNRVRWEFYRTPGARGVPCLMAKLFFNGEYIGRRLEYQERLPCPIGVVLEVVDGRLLFDNVEIRRMTPLVHPASASQNP